MMCSVMSLHCGSRKLIATSNRLMSARVITRLAAHNGDATHRPLALLGSGQPLAVGPAAAPDNPWLTPDAYASGDNTGNIHIPLHFVVRP
jgi:hypothetical protein